VLAPGSPRLLDHASLVLNDGRFLHHVPYARNLAAGLGRCSRVGRRAEVTPPSYGSSSWRSASPEIVRCLLQGRAASQPSWAALLVLFLFFPSPTTFSGRQGIFAALAVAMIASSQGRHPRRISMETAVQRCCSRLSSTACALFMDDRRASGHCLRLAGPPAGLARPEGNLVVVVAFRLYVFMAPPEAHRTFPWDCGRLCNTITLYLLLSATPISGYWRRSRFTSRCQVRRTEWA